MANVSVYNMEGKEVGSMELNDAVFGVEVNEHLVHLAVVAQLANKRQGTQKAKTRSEVSGGGRKPWRQKGTGHARQGSTRSPQWKGGCVVFAPVPRDYSQIRKAFQSHFFRMAGTCQYSNILSRDAIFLSEIFRDNQVVIGHNTFCLLYTSQYEQWSCHTSQAQFGREVQLEELFNLFNP